MILMSSVFGRVTVLAPSKEVPAPVLSFVLPLGTKPIDPIKPAWAEGMLIAAITNAVTNREKKVTRNIEKPQITFKKPRLSWRSFRHFSELGQ